MSDSSCWVFGRMFSLFKLSRIAIASCADSFTIACPVIIFGAGGCGATEGRLATFGWPAGESGFTMTEDDLYSFQRPLISVAVNNRQIMESVISLSRGIVRFSIG